ncbi:MAG: RNA polymerase sigma factor [Nocardioidaceae bacterium]
MDAPEEFEWLFATQYRSIVWSANVILHDYSKAEEIAQDAFVSLLENWKKVAQYDRPGAWVRRVAIRLATRAAKREAQGAQLAAAWPTVADVQPVDLDLMAAIRQLPPRQRAVIALFYIEDLPVSEVADILSCGTATVSVHLHRARKRLTELLGEEVEASVG